MDGGGNPRSAGVRTAKSRAPYALVDDLLKQAGLIRCRDVRVSPPRSSFAGFRFPPVLIMVAVRSAVRWYLRCGLPYRDVQELLAEREVQVDHVTIHR